MKQLILAHRTAMTDLVDYIHAVNDFAEDSVAPALIVGRGVVEKVVVGNVGSDRFAKFSAIGTPVNIAARVESFSLPGQVLITEETRRQTKAVLNTVGSLRVKAKGVTGHVMIHDVAAIEGENAVSLEVNVSRTDKSE